MWQNCGCLFTRAASVVYSKSKNAQGQAGAAFSGMQSGKTV
jgi:hypothetical protein